MNYTFEEFFKDVYGMDVWDSPLELYNKAKRLYKEIMEEENSNG